MKMPVFRVTVIMISVCSLSANFIYIPTQFTWPQAQNYCRVHYTDLLPISTGFANHLFRWRVKSHNTSGWIGLHRDLDNPTDWRWSGGGFVTFKNWKYLDPNHFVGYWTVQGWRSARVDASLGFYCFKLIVIGERKSWEEAMESCRQNYTSLISMTSRTELLLAKRQIQQDHISDRVWIGLRFLRNRWMWVNSDPLSFQAWPEGSQDHQCPVEGRCGALNKQGLWENWDCQEKLNFICS